MKTSKLSTFVVILLAAWGGSAALAQPIAATPKEMDAARQWAARFDAASAKAVEPPFSFSYDGKPSAQLLKQWKQTQTSHRLDDQRFERTTIWTDATTGLEVRCVSVTYADYPVVEWTVYFKNTGRAATPILADIQGMDVTFPGDGKGNFVLRSIRGDDCGPSSYQPTLLNIGKGAVQRFASAGGRPTYGGYPYFNVECSPGQGIIAVLGWPGQWAAQFECDQSARLRIRGGQELTRLKLLPGEDIRTPLSLLMFWQGDNVRTHNLWRRWMLAHNTPRIKGEPPLPATYTMGETAVALKPVASAELADIDALVKSGNTFDYWWIDAGWYPMKGSWGETGTWIPDPERFPKGIKQVSDYAHSKGMKFVLWFEPERVAPGSWLATHHPQWILGGANGGLLNLGNPEARKWVIEHVCRFIKEQGVDLYREDFNIDPLAYWRNNDASDRQGMTENLHIQGHLAYWDELRRRFPDNLIDSCASGGRRNDIETLRRAVPLLRSDYKGNGSPEVIVANQGHTYGLAMWVPFHGTGEFYNDNYSYRSHLCPAMGTCNDPNKKPVDWRPLKKALADWQAIGAELLGDYYPLTPYSLSEDEWMAWQFNRPETGTGVVQAFRHVNSVYESIRVRLQGLEKGAVYTLTNLDSPGSTEMTGRELSDRGLLVGINAPRGTAIIVYKKKS
jgi:alpha-galactosidase